MKMIWYNPLIDDYQLGTLKEYYKQANGEEKERFEVLYEFDLESMGVAEKILNNLRKVHSVTSRYVYMAA